MPRKPLKLVAALVVALSATLTLTTGAAQAESNGGVRVMPLGDSITDGFGVPGAYRTGLWQRFVNADYRVDFVGSGYNGPSNLGDHDHEGHSGWRIDQIDAAVVAWLRTYTPHTVLLHIGTNDIIQNRDLANAPARLSTVVDKITATAPDAEVFVATLIPLGDATQEANVRAFNAAVPGIVQSKVNAGRKVHLVDMHSAVSAADLYDGIHPSAAGHDKMAAAWYAALRAVPGSIGSPGDDPTPPTGTCAATYALTGQWSGGFQASVTVTAGSSLTGWAVTLRYGNGQTVNQAWNATITRTGDTFTARDAGYNGTLAPGARAEFGFLASGAAETPTLTCAAA
ncbi:cellulose binding domain-containing protein [Actinophytocola oryzae]|uniref:GDSL-like lipase/acylhydrolase family protein n=1 Tax=Actinophytocola oryzae TaxID=502181 RepID=A0A4R7W3S0_9PSEU|nr:cellulose binding domain-containing protein [Actinophytocola oryzae]TDV57320.1 GDSL-like lipase/acylhydrolase family protein [Actinophytocola oryzae]